MFFLQVQDGLYLILWIAIPEAKTTAEKVSNERQKRADINNISLKL